MYPANDEVIKPTAATQQPSNLLLQHIHWSCLQRVELELTCIRNVFSPVEEIPVILIK